MSILQTDIKLLESERMTDTTDGGGRRTARVIPDGVPGNIFPKISRTDSVYGRVNMRKIYGAVQTANVDTYAGAHAALMDAPDNNRIHVCIFSTGSDFDDRTAARDRVESYVIAGPESRMITYGRQLVGQGAITVYQRVEEPLPEIGDVFCLSNEDTGIVAYQQYVRIEDVSHEVRTFTDDKGDFTRRVVTMKIGATLRYEFAGVEVPSRETSRVAAALMRTTTVADASRYFGVQALTGGVLKDALQINVADIYTQIVPTSQRETAVVNAEIGSAVSTVPAGVAPLDWHEFGDPWTTWPNGSNFQTRSISVGRPIVPGTLLVKADYSGTGAYGGDQAKDDGKGVILGTPGNGVQQISGGTVDYANGIVTVTVRWSYPGGNLASLWARFTPAVEVSQPAHLHEIPVTLGTRGTVQVLTLDPLPQRGTLFVDYRALGKWYRLSDDGTGKLAGNDAAYGTGTVDFVTGSLVMTLGALPDVGSSVIVGWASPAHYQTLAGATADAQTGISQEIKLSNLPIYSETVRVTFLSNGIAFTATGDVNGVITGNGVSGSVDHTSGRVALTYTTKVPDPRSVVTVTYDQVTPADPLVRTYQSGDSPYVGDGTLATVTNVKPKYLYLELLVSVSGVSGGSGGPQIVKVGDDGNGNVITLYSTFVSDGQTYYHLGGVKIGTIDYASGNLTFTANSISCVRNYYTYQQAALGGTSMAWRPNEPINCTFALGSWHWSVSLNNASVAAHQTETSDTGANGLRLDFTKTSTSTIVPGSLMFDALGRSYYDLNGVLYHSMMPDGTGTSAGTVDYQSGVATITDWVAGAALGLLVRACLAKYGQFTANSSVFRTAGSPLRAASTFVQVTAYDGEVLTATCDQNGVLIGANVRGSVNQQMGVVRIQWGAMVLAAGNETQPWYDPANVEGTQVWKPRDVMPGDLRYNAVVIASLPLNADIIGLDPVRLPADGRVPIYRAGDVVVIHNTQTTALPNPVAAGATYSVGRAQIVDLTLFDANGVAIPVTQYVADLDAGTVTMAANMALGAAVQPLSARHRIEELNLASDVQIDGQITLTSPLSRDFGDGTLVSGALLFGDLFARVANVFDQVSWTNVWDDARIGANATAEYDTINHPIEVRNDSAVTERWRINFTTGTAYQVIGENLGVIATGTTTADCSPINSLTGLPYFTLRAAGFGLGWAVGNQIRFNTVGATASIWMTRTILAGASRDGDSIDIQLRGDVDA